MKLATFGMASAFVLAMAAQAGAQEMSAQERAHVMRLLRQTPLIDGHNDLPWTIRSDHGNDLGALDLMSDTRRLDKPMHTDLPRMREGGVGGQFWSVYVPAALQGLESHKTVLEQIDLVRRMVGRYPDRLEMAVTADDVVRIHRQGKIASLLGIEGGEAIAGNLALLREFRASGVGYMTLTHSKNNAWVDSATDAPQHGGLSPFGEDVVREMNKVGMLVDLSHVSAEAMRDAIRVSRAPVIFSHSSALAIDPHPRNVPDDVLRLLPANGGVVMVNFYSTFVSPDYLQWASRRKGEEERLKFLNPGDPEAVKTALATWVSANPAPVVPLSIVADHIDHIRQVAGVDHVGIGSDYDGVDALPVGLDGVEDYPALLAELIRRGWSDRDIRKLAGENVLRAMRRAEEVARRS
ncbi:MAG: dipeptidase [Hyphomonadaceae bacterium]|nr:dipeptidase [Hyphomonadaceae bacterium]